MVTLTFKVTDLEAHQLREAAANEGSTLSNFLRKKVFTDSNSSLITSLNVAQADLRKLLELAKDVKFNQQISDAFLQIVIKNLEPDKADKLISDTIIQAYERAGEKNELDPKKNEV